MRQITRIGLDIARCCAASRRLSKNGSERRWGECWIEPDKVRPNAFVAPLIGRPCLGRKMATNHGERTAPA